MTDDTGAGRTSGISATLGQNQGMNEAPASLVSRLIGPLCGIAVGTVTIALAQTITLPAIDGQFSPRWWPQLSGVAILLFSLAAAVRAISPNAPMDELNTRQSGGVVRITASLAAILVYSVLWPWIDFRIATVLLVVALVAISGVRGWVGLIVFPVAVTTLLWLLFSVLLRVPV